METYKFLNRLSPGFHNNVFHKNFLNPYALPNGQELSSRNPEPVRCETETISYIAPKIGSKIPETIKMKSSLETRVCACVCVCVCVCVTFVQNTYNMLVLLIMLVLLLMF